MYSHAHTLFFILMLLILCLVPECDSWFGIIANGFLHSLSLCLGGIIVGNKEGTNINHTNQMQNPLIIGKTP